jgi:hypothetical protein
MAYFLIFFNPKPVILANHSPVAHLNMHLAREGAAEYNKAMKNCYRIMLGAKSAFAGTHKISFKLEKK